MKNNASLFSRNLKIVMADMGVSSEETAKAIGVTVQNVNNWLNGRNKPRPEVLKKIADHFGFTPTFFVEQDLGEIRQRKMDIENKDAHIEVNVGDTLRIIKARTGVILTALSELLSEKSGRLSALELSDLETMVNDQLKQDGKGR